MSRINVNRVEFERAVIASERYARGLEQLLRQRGGAKVAVRAATPRGRHRGKHARDTIDVVIVGREIRVQSTDAFWHLIEFGSVNNPAYAPMRRGLTAIGLRLTESSI